MRISARFSLSAAPIIILLATSTWAGPLHDAAREGDIDKVRRLITEGADVQAIDKETALTPLIEAALAGHRDVAVLIIESGADPSGQDGKGFTALHAAAYTGHLDIVMLLIKQGVNVDDHKNKSGVTPLHAATEGNFLDIAKVLLSQDADINIEDGSGWTPVMRATFKSYPEMVKLLREHGATCLKNAGEKFFTYCMTAGG